jgi:hypothetical protein
VPRGSIGSLYPQSILKSVLEGPLYTFQPKIGKTSDRPVVVQLGRLVAGANLQVSLFKRHICSYFV